MNFLPALLNAVPIHSSDVIKRIGKFNDVIIEPLKDGVTISAGQVLLKFISCLGKLQIERLMYIWTGSPTPCFKNLLLSIEFIQRSEGSVKVDFCNPKESQVSRHKGSIASGHQYLELFQRFTRELYGSKVKILPHCPPGDVELVPISLSTGKQKLLIPIQSVQRMFNSLVYLLRVPIFVWQAGDDEMDSGL